MAQYQRKLKAGIRWWYKFDYKGKTYSSECVYVSKKEVQKAEHAKYEEVSKKLPNSGEKPILSLLEAINERLEYIQAKKSVKYFNENKKHYKHLLRSLGNRLLTEIEKSDINSFLIQLSQKLKNKGKDNYTVNASLRMYKALFNYVIQNHDLHIKNPCLGIALYPIKKKIKYIPTDEEINEVKSLCDAEQIRLIDFVMQTGARISEALRITGKDVGDGYVILYTRKSFNSNLVPRKVYHSLLLSNITSDERLFKRWTESPKFLELKVKQLKHTPWNWHSLRHRFASRLSKSNIPLFEIMIKLGHTQLSTTQRYLQLLP